MKEKFFSCDDQDIGIDPLLDFASWKCKHSITTTAANDLLERFKKCPAESSLQKFPSDIRTLVKTPRTTNIVSLGTGQYTHYTLEKSTLFSVKTS